MDRRWPASAKLRQIILRPKSSASVEPTQLLRQGIVTAIDKKKLAFGREVSWWGDLFCPF